MKKLLLVALVSLLVVGCGKSEKQSLAERRHIQVVGFASQKLKPDQLRMTVAVGLQDKNMKSAKDRMDLAQAKVWEALKNLGIEKSTIEESGVQFHRDRDYSSNRQLVYFVRNDIQFKIRDFSVYESVVNAMTTIPDVNVNPPQPVISNEREIRDIVRSEAVIDAQKKADAMLQPLHQKLGKPLVIHEFNHMEQDGYFPTAGARSIGISDPSRPARPQSFAAGDQEISAQVNILFEIED